MAQDEEKEYNTTVTVKVHGEEKVKHIEFEVQKEATFIMKKIKYKNKCEDLFKNTVINAEKGLRMYPKVT